MNKKSVFGLLLFSCIVIAGMFLGTMLLIGQPPESDYNQAQQEISKDATDEDGDLIQKPTNEESNSQDKATDTIPEGEWYYSTDINSHDTSDDPENLEDTISSDIDEEENAEDITNPEEDTPDTEGQSSPNNEDTQSNDEETVVDSNPDQDLDSAEHSDEPQNNEDTDTISGNVLELPDLQLIRDSNLVDYMKYIPDMVYDSRIENALDITNPELDIRAKSAILIDANTGEVLYYKDPVIPVFPASTAKLLTALVTLDWCMEEEQVTVGDEVKMVASDSTLARIKKGQVLTIRNLLEGMLVPSGNDAAYVLAAHVGRKSLQNENAGLVEAIPEFIRLMNEKANSLGVVNSVFKTPDGYDAIGQYTTAYDMGIIGMAAADNDSILAICNKTTARNVFIDGFDVTWSSTNSLIVKESGRYYPYCLGLKTGTSTMAGRCLISVAKKDDKEVISVVMNSDAVGRWEDSTTLLKYGLDN